MEPNRSSHVERLLGRTGGKVTSELRDRAYWLNLAAEARVMAEALTHPHAKSEMQVIVAAYERLARRADDWQITLSRLRATNDAAPITNDALGSFVRK